jgi:formylglycine-generating enzyme required for sulfatase activity
MIGACAAVAGLTLAPSLIGPRQAQPSEVYRGLKIFKDCADQCPEMVALPPGTLMLRPTAQDPWGAPRTITFSKGFAIGRYDVTRQEYAKFVKETGYRVPNNCFTITKVGDVAESHGDWSKPGFPQTDRDPAVCLSWDDANAYAMWLSRRTGAAYRLPTETEWAYAAGPSPVLMGERGSLLCKRLNGADLDYHANFPGDPAVDQRCSDGYAFTSPVGKFPANIYGLYDVLGDVWQWVQDCYDERPLTQPLNGEASLATPCSTRVVRGGSWSDDLKKIRPTRRGEGSPGDRYPQNGFRIARDL